MKIVYHLPLIERLKLNVAPLPSELLSAHIFPLWDSMIIFAKNS